MLGELTKQRPRSEAEWLGLRKGRMTSSLAAAALGLSPFATPLDAWVSITGRDTFDGNKACIRGTRLESVVLDYPTRGGHLRRKSAPFVSTDWTGDSTDCLYLSADGLLVGEGKTVAQGGAAAWGEEGTDEIPEHTIVQSCWHLAHWPEASACLVPVLVGGFAFEFREYVLQRDDELIGHLVETLHKWHRDYVVTDMPPPATAGDDDVLKHVWPSHVEDKFIAPTPEIEGYVRAYLDAREAAKVADAEKQGAGARLRQLLEDAEGSRGEGWIVTHKRTNPKKAVTNWEAVALALGATDHDIEAHTSLPAGYRQLLPRLVKPPKPKAAKKKKKKESAE